MQITDESIEEATCRVFKIGDISVMVDLKDLCRRFGLEWNFVSRRSGKLITCNRASRTSSFVKSSIRKSLSIVCGCGWLVRFRGVEWGRSTNSDPIIITGVCEVYCNSYNPTFVDQFLLSRTRADLYKIRDDHSHSSDIYRAFCIS